VIGCCPARISARGRRSSTWAPATGSFALAAADLVGPSGTVIFSDSQALLEHARSVAERRGLAGRASFVRASAEDLGPIADASVHVVTTRSVLIYVYDKRRAFREFHRVLRPGGRVSIFEPINRYFEESADDFWGFDARPVEDLSASSTPAIPMRGWTTR
jgi:ubiquinone/menaquinone biosynthesis C-methylase UbiE